MCPNWGLDDEPTPEEVARREAQREPIRQRARRRLDRVREKLPRLTKAQTAILVEMMVDAYEAGDVDRDQVACYEKHDEAMERSRKGVIARRRKSKRMAIVKAFEAATASRKDVSVEQLAQEHGVSRATAYRALNMMSAGKASSKARD